MLCNPRDYNRDFKIACNASILSWLMMIIYLLIERGGEWSLILLRPSSRVNTASSITDITKGHKWTKLRFSSSLYNVSTTAKLYYVLHLRSHGCSLEKLKGRPSHFPREQGCRLLKNTYTTSANCQTKAMGLFPNTHPSSQFHKSEVEIVRGWLTIQFRSVKHCRKVESTISGMVD